MSQKILLALLTFSLLPAGLRAGQQEDMQRMAAQHKHDAPAATAAATAEPAQPVTGEEVVYGEVGGKPVRGYLARPKNAGDAGSAALPGLIVIQEWWGLNDNIRAMTRRLAGEGYTALAVDLYGGAVAQTPEQAQKLMQGVLQNTAAGSENLRQAYGYLEKQRKAPSIGVIGWCFGGGWSLQTALMIPEGIDAAVMYYGRIEADKAELGKLRAPLLGFFGAADASIPVAKVRAFEADLKQLGKNAEIHVYEGADHAFANPSGGNYNAKAAADSWAKTTAFFRQHLPNAKAVSAVKM